MVIIDKLRIKAVLLFFGRDDWALKLARLAESF